MNASSATELAQAVLAGEPGALARWYEIEHARVWRLCLGFLAGREEADDVAQDAMLHLHDNLARWDPKRSWDTWRNTVVLNLCRDHRRRTAARSRAEKEAAAERLPRTLPHPVHELEQREVSALVSDCLVALSDREREAFVLHDLEGRETEEVAAAMDIAASSVRALLTLARRRLRNLLAPKLEGFAAGGEGA